MEATQVCPMCGNEIRIKDIELFMQKMNEAWELIKPIYVDLPLEMQQEIKEKNSIINIKECMDEKGHFRAVCQPCMNIMSWKLQLGLK